MHEGVAVASVLGLRLTSLDYRGGFETADTEAAGGRGGCRGQATCAEGGPRVRRHGLRGSLVKSVLCAAPTPLHSEPRDPFGTPQKPPCRLAVCLPVEISGRVCC